MILCVLVYCVLSAAYGVIINDDYGLNIFYTALNIDLDLDGYYL